MTKEVAKLKLHEAQSNLKMAEIVLEMHENGVRELREDIENLEELISKPERWQDKLVKGEFSIITGRKGLTCDKGFARDKIEHTFKEESHAKIMANKMQLMQEMHAFAHVKNEGWIANWGSLSEKKFGILYSTYDGFEVECSVECSGVCNYFIFGISVESKEIAEEMLEEFGEGIEAIYNKQY